MLCEPFFGQADGAKEHPLAKLTLDAGINPLPLRFGREADRIEMRDLRFAGWAAGYLVATSCGFDDEFVFAQQGERNARR